MNQSKLGVFFFSIERAKSNRGKCRECKDIIEVNSLRLKEVAPTKKYLEKKYYCKKCAERILKKIRKNADNLIEILQSDIPLG